MSAHVVPPHHTASGQAPYAEHLTWQSTPPRCPQSTDATAAHDFMKSMPWDADAEKGVLSCFLQDPTTLLSDAEAHLPDTAFYHPANRLLYQVMKRFHQGGEHPVEYIALTAYLRDTHQLDAIGGPAMLSELLYFAPALVHYGYYKGILRDKMRLREIITTCLDAAARAQEHQPDVDHFTTETCARFARLEQAVAGQDESREMMGWSIDELLDYESDPEENLLGNGWLRRGGAAIFVGPSGVGKSSASMQQDMCWALGRESFGIEPARPLRILTIQSENDMDDLHEMTEGVLAHLNITAEERQMLNERTRYLSWTAARGDVFLAKLRTAIRLFKPDLVRVDPLQGFAGCQIEDSQQIGNFLRAGLNPILQEHRCGLILAHHTPKPRQDARTDRRALDFAYAGAGGAEITNWARAILAIEVKSDHEFAFHAAKRGRRIGWENVIGYSETTRYFRHATEPGQMHWEEITDEAVKRSLACPNKSKDAEKFLMKHVPQVGSIEKKQLIHLAKQESGIGHNTLTTDLARLLNADNPQIFQYHEKRPDVRPLVRITRQRSSGD